MGKFSVRTSAARLMITSAVAVFIVLVSPWMSETAYGYEAWFKFYDINMNEISDGSEIDLETFQKGIYIERYLDCTDGDPVRAFVAMQYSANQTNATGTSKIVENADSFQLVKKYDDDFQQFSDDNAYFTGVKHALMFVELSRIGPDATINLTLRWSHYYPPVNSHQYAGETSISVAVGGSTKEEGSSGESAHTDSDDSLESEKQTSETEDKGSTVASSEPETEREASDTTKEGESEPKKHADSARGESSVEQVGDSNISTENGDETGRQSDSDEQGQETIASSTAEPTDSDGNNGGSSGERSSDSASNALKDARPTTAKAGGQRLADMGAVFMLGRTNASASSDQVKSSRIELTGMPFLYLVLTVVLLAMAPIGLGVRTLRGRRDVGAASRLLGV